MSTEVKYDCRYFKGDVPCKFNKLDGSVCDCCEHYDKVEGKILIIKLARAGDVIRTTPLLRRLKHVYPKFHITWLTCFPEFVPDVVDSVFTFNPQNILYLQQVHFDILYNLDKEVEACALANLVSAATKKGFHLKDGKCHPIDKDAEHKFLTGIFDQVSKANTKSYPQEIFEICGFEFKGEEYILENFASEGYNWRIEEPKPLVGLNTGCGGTWRSRLWGQEKWVELAQSLKSQGIGVVLLGGEGEHQRNTYISKESKASYLGYFPIRKFVNLIDQCDTVVTAVTMATHIAIGLRKGTVLLNNTFNPSEFELYGSGQIVEPDFDCDCYYSPICPNDCMQYISPQKVFNTCLAVLESQGENLNLL